MCYPCTYTNVFKPVCQHPLTAPLQSDNIGLLTDTNTTRGETMSAIFNSIYTDVKESNLLVGFYNANTRNFEYYNFPRSETLTKKALERKYNIPPNRDSYIEYFA